MKYIILVCDGMADRPTKNEETPLESARTPNFDRIAREGVCGIMDTIRPGIPPGSDTAHLSFLGYDPYKSYIGRGPMEALGGGIELEPGDIAFRTNFATVDSKWIIKDRRAGRIKGELTELESAINKIKLPVEFVYHHTVDHRGVLVLKASGLFDKVSDSDPHESGTKVKDIKALEPKAKKTADILNKFSKEVYKVLDKHPFNKGRKLPANMLLIRGAGTYRPVDSFEERHGISGACIAAMALVRGVAKYVGLELIDVPGATGDENTDIAGKFNAAIKALETHDFCLINVKATDNFSHDGNFDGKRKFIEKIDPHLPILIDGLKGKGFLAVMADHTTPVSLKNHSGDPVPIAIMGEGVRIDDVKKYGERSCAMGGLNRIRGLDLTPIMINLAGKARLFGA